MNIKPWMWKTAIGVLIVAALVTFVVVAATQSTGGLVAPWVTDSSPIIQAVLAITIAVCCLVMIIAILASPAQAGRGSNAITGASESFYTKNKGKNNQGRIRNLIIAMAITIAVCAIMYFVSWQIASPGATPPAY